MFVFALACSSSSKRNGPAAPEDAGADTGTETSWLCMNVPCGEGQVCAEVEGQSACVPSCDKVECPEEQHCEIVGRFGTCVDRCIPACSAGQRCDSGACLDNSCEDLACSDTEACAPATAGSGNVCVNNTCDDDVDCADDQSCRDGICQGDTCEPNARRCDGRALLECAANGSSELTRMTCTDAQHTQSECIEGTGAAHCSCRDDWDCPEFSRCSAKRCEGTGREPHCFLPPTSFSELLPSDEPGFPWGGDDADGYKPDGTLQHADAMRSRDAHGHPFPRHAQVITTPIVANLDDDNGDGLVNELDLPEIIFTSFCDANYFNHGVLRALHGGGPNAGNELFARCEEKVWHEGDPVSDDEGRPLEAASCGCTAGDLEPTGSVAVGDLDADGWPEIVVAGHAPNAGDAEIESTRVLILDRRGETVSDNTIEPLPGDNPSITLANVDGQGLSEIVIGARVLILKKEAGKLSVAHVLAGSEGQGVNRVQGPIGCAGDLDGDGRMEIVAGATAYRVPQAPSGDCPADVDALSDDERAYCRGELPVIWSAGTDGFCAIADVAAEGASADNRDSLAGPGAPLDGQPEVILLTLGRLQIYTRTGERLVDEKVTSGAGGAPNVDDFDGDGFPEIGTAGLETYVLYDLQPPRAQCPAWPTALSGAPGNQAGNPNPERTPPAQSCKVAVDCGDEAQFTCGKQGSCVCLHNGWTSKTQDASSNATGSSVFDFNGDGAAEVVYNDECYFRIYDGSNGYVHQRLDSQSPTRVEYPVVADVDNDGNAEIIFAVGNSRSENCPSEGKVRLRNGVRVIGDPSDRWISARRIWNQHAYHVTNVLESGAVPEHEAPSWISYAGRNYNTYRSNIPQLGHVAPDLTVRGVSITSPDVMCGESLSNDIRVVARIVNQGDLRVGRDVLVRFQDQDGKTLGEKPIGVGLEPGNEARVTLDYHADSTEALPRELRVTVDAAMKERECVEDNNTLTQKLGAENTVGSELTVAIEQLGQACPLRRLKLRVENKGSVRVDEVPVHLYAGLPSAGGTVLAVHQVGPVEANGKAEIEADIDSRGRDLTVVAVVNPDSTIPECDESNNTAETQIMCFVALQ